MSGAGLSPATHSRPTLHAAARRHMRLRPPRPPPLAPGPAARRQPVFLTLCHMMACCSLAYALSLTRAFPIKPLRSRRQLSKVCLLASIFCVTIVLGNMSLRYIAVSFSQAVGASTPLFTAMLAFALQGARQLGTGGGARGEGTAACRALASACLLSMPLAGGPPRPHAAFSRAAMRGARACAALPQDRCPRPRPPSPTRTRHPNLPPATQASRRRAPCMPRWCRSCWA